MEYNDVYDADRRPTGRVHLRGTRWEPGDYGLLAVCWIYDGHGKLLLTRRAREKTYAGTWENSGGAVQAGEDSRQAVAREVFEETGIRAEPAEFEFLDTGRDGQMFVDHYLFGGGGPDRTGRNVRHYCRAVPSPQKRPAGSAGCTRKVNKVW